MEDIVLRCNASCDARQPARRKLLSRLKSETMRRAAPIGLSFGADQKVSHTGVDFFGAQTSNFGNPLAVIRRKLRIRLRRPRAVTSLENCT